MARRITTLCVALAITACGGTAEPETAADVESAPDDSEPEPESETESAEEMDTEESAEAAGPASKQDVQAVLQLVLDDESLQPSLGLEKTGRFPFKLAGDAIPTDLELTKNTEAVQIVDKPTDSKQAVMVITELDISGDQASVRYRYDIEGVRGSATLEKGDFGWELTNSSVVKR